MAPWTAEAWNLSWELKLLLETTGTEPANQTATEPEKGETEMPVIKATSGGGAKVEPGTYIVRCLDAKLDHIENSQFGTGDVIRLGLEIEGELDDEGNPVQLDAIANWKLTPSSKLWSWAEAFGCQVAVGMDFDTDDLIDKRAQAVIVDKANSDGAVFSRVENIVPMPRAARQQSVINPDGSANWTVFWQEARKLKHDKASVAHFRGEDAPPLQTLDGADAQELLGALKEGVPFEN